MFILINYTFSLSPPIHTNVIIMSGSAFPGEQCNSPHPPARPHSKHILVPSNKTEYHTDDRDRDRAVDYCITKIWFVIWFELMMRPAMNAVLRLCMIEVKIYRRVYAFSTAWLTETDVQITAYNNQILICYVTWIADAPGIMDMNRQSIVSGGSIHVFSDRAWLNICM